MATQRRNEISFVILQDRSTSILTNLLTLVPTYIFIYLTYVLCPVYLYHY